MPDALPAPLVPADVDLRDFPYLPVDIARLFNSEFHALSCDAAWRAGFTLWLKSYHQVPAASIPDDDVSLTRLAELGRDVAAWRAIKAEALRGWVKCADGRLYHPVVAEKALEAWIEKLTLRKASGAGNAKRYGGTFDAASFDASIADSMALLAGLNPNSRMLAKRATRAAGRRDPTPTPGGVPPASLPDSHPAPTGSENGSHRESRCDPTPTPGNLPVGSQEKGSEGIYSVLTDGGPSPPAGPPAFRSVLGDPPGGAPPLRLVPDPEPAGARPPGTADPPDPAEPERELFARGKAVLGASAGGQVTKLLRAKGGNIALARAAIETASTKHNAREYVSRIIRGDDTGMPPGQLYDRSI